MQLSVPNPEAAAALIMEKWLYKQNHRTKLINRHNKIHFTCSDVNMTSGPGNDCNPSLLTRGYLR